MARLPTLMLLILSTTACTVAEQPPPFNSCWTLFPPGPEFDRQIQEYDSPSSPEQLAAACLPTHQLDSETCMKFSMAGRGEWPNDVENWCREKYQIRLDTN
jgi:hypothetical protein